MRNDKVITKPIVVQLGKPIKLYRAQIRCIYILKHQWRLQLKISYLTKNYIVDYYLTMCTTVIIFIFTYLKWLLTYKLFIQFSMKNFLMNKCNDNNIVKYHLISKQRNKRGHYGRRFRNNNQRTTEDKITEIN